jgi:hypothetical protein
MPQKPSRPTLADSQLAAWVRRSCQKQGLPETISETGLVAMLANLVFIARESAAVLSADQAT